jgi:hypothetical protein
MNWREIEPSGAHDAVPRLRAVAYYRHSAHDRHYVAHPALATAGIPDAPEKPIRRCKWTREHVLSALQARYQEGTSLTSVWRDCPALYNAAKR